LQLVYSNDGSCAVAAQFCERASKSQQRTAAQLWGQQLLQVGVETDIVHETAYFTMDQWLRFPYVSTVFMSLSR
jgi:hypothetical protein